MRYTKKLVAARIISDGEMFQASPPLVDRPFDVRLGSAGARLDQVLDLLLDLPRLSLQRLRISGPLLVLVERRL